MGLLYIVPPLLTQLIEVTMIVQAPFLKRQLQKLNC